MARGLISSLMTAALLSASVAHAVPEGEAGRLDASGELGALTGLAVSDDGALVGAADRDLGGVYIWHEAAFSTPTSASGCPGAESVVFVPQATVGDRFYVGCDEGAVLEVRVDGSVPPVLTVDSSVVLNEGAGAVTHLGWAEGDAYVHAVVQDGSNFSVHRFSVADRTDIDGAGLPLSGTGTMSAMTVGANGSGILLTDTNGVMSFISRDVTYVAATSPPLVVQGSTVDLVTSSRVTESLWADRTSGDVWVLSNLVSSNTATRFLTGTVDPSGIAYVFDGTELRVWLGLQDGTVDAYGATDGALDASFSVGSGHITAFAAPSTADDPVFAMGSDGTVRVLSDRPWISEIAAEPSSVETGGSFTLTFTSDLDGTYDIRTGGPDADDGSSLASGSVAAGVAVSTTLDESDLTTEGENRLFVFVEDESGALGKDSVVVTRDTPPDPVTALRAEGGDDKLVVTWTSTSETDIASFDLYVSDIAFSADDALPNFSVLVNEGTDEERTDDYPVEVEWTSASMVHTHTVEGLTNGTTYYVTVVAMDEGGAEGAVAAVVSGVPMETCAASECAEDDYGCTCAPNSIVAAPVAPRSVAALSLLLCILFPIVRRR